MAKVLWIVLAVVVVVCFVSCSKEGPAGPQGSQGTQGSQGSTGATGAPGAPGIPRKMFIGRYSSTFSIPNGNQTYRWTANAITLPWTPASNGVTANFRGFWLYYVGSQNCILDAVNVSGNQVTVSGQVWTATGSNTLTVYYDVIASDTLETLLFNDNIASISGSIKESSMPAVSGSKMDLP